MSSRSKRLGFALNIGFFAGVIWGGLKTIEFSLKFTVVPPGFLIDPFFKHPFLATWMGMLLGLAAFIVLSIIAAMIYEMGLRKAKGPYWGVGYGVVWWVLLYVLLGPLTGMMLPLTRLDRTSSITDGCLFILWGLFIGYSLAFEYTNEQNREP